MPVGTLRKWDGRRLFGWLVADDANRGGGAIFVHMTEMRRGGCHDPANGDAFAYAVETRQGRSEAVDVVRIHRAQSAAA